MSSNADLQKLISRLERQQKFAWVHGIITVGVLLALVFTSNKGELATAGLCTILLVQFLVPAMTSPALLTIARNIAEYRDRD